ncbi:MAG: DUF2914 domain-containing protein [Propionivibrio sp.]|nr:DUF2914 domain-containing protein [Propionivibrio sp.]
MKIPSFVIVLAVAAALSGPAAFAQDGGAVINATFTSDVADGKPVDFRQQFMNSTPAVFYYGELLGLTGQAVKLRWSLEGKSKQEESIKVTRAQQPVWSKMKMQEEWTGDWTVMVLNGQGQVIDQWNFAFSPPL